MVDCRRIDEQIIDIACFEADKLEVLRIVTNLEGPVVDIEVLPAKLEQVYAHFTEIGDDR